MGWDNPSIPWRDFHDRLTWHPDAGAPPPVRKERPPAPEPVTDPPAGTGPPWAELHVHSSFSFLDGASSPEALVQEAARRGIEVMALTDHDGMYGAVQFAKAAEKHGIGTVFGAELSLGLRRAQSGMPDPEGGHLLVLARGEPGYRRLCAAISAAQLAGGAKGRPVYDLDDLARRHEGHWAVLTGCRKGAVPAALAERGPDAAEAELRRLVALFGTENVFVELIDQDRPLDDARNDALYELAHRVGVDVVASGNVHYARPGEAPLAQTLAAVRSRRALDDMASWLPATGGAHLRDGEEMAARLAHFPGVMARTVELARDCAFTFDVVAPDLPNWDVPGGHDEATQLRRLVAEGARDRYGPPEIAPQAHRQITHELHVIEEQGFPGYFLIVHDIVAFCKKKRILCQGRGSAANSAVCYALGITNADPIRYKLLFERFLSPGRDGPPDIDVDIEHRRREEVIQYVYEKYGRDRAAQVANVISYRPRMAVRDAARALGYSQGQQDAWSKLIGPGHDGRGASPAADPDIPGPVAELAGLMTKLPRHLGIHSGGMVICDRPVGEVCPVEWATMPGRTVLQWDKDDCAGAGLVKFDLLGLGMLSCLRDTFDLVAEHHGVRYDLDSIPKEEPAVYAMLCDADSVGVFQVESRAQMATLPRLRPEEFYDLVVEVALIRPGPIQGGSVHPYLRRRRKREPVTYPHELMRPALSRTLGVPLFQEQMMQLAVDCAGFSPAEADRLRQAMSAKRAPERIEELRERLLTGMAANGISGAVAEDVYQKILGFASFGFPESHAISFALLVYASAWLKRHHPAAFTAALLRNQPMGFYHPQTLIADARRHGVRVRGVDVNASDVEATLAEKAPMTCAHPHAPREDQPVIRIGLSSVRNLGKDAAAAIVAGQPYADLADFAHRTDLSSAAVEGLATAGAFGCFGLSRREALWAAGAVAGIHGGHLPVGMPGMEAPPLPGMTPVEETIADLWATGVSRVHPIAHLRAELDARGAVPASGLGDVPDGTHIAVGGMITHRQHPATAGGVVFVNLEDETGMVNVICPPYVWERHRRTALEAAALIIYGRVERGDGAVNLVASRLRELPVTRVTGDAAAPSRDFR